MSVKADQMMRAKALLHEAINLAASAMPNSHVVAEARFHMKQAMNRIDKVAKEQLEKKKAMGQNQFENWWGKVVTGTAAASHTPMSGEARNRTLGQLDAMIAEEYKKLNELEKQTPEQSNQGPLRDDGVDLLNG